MITILLILEEMKEVMEELSVQHKVQDYSRLASMEEILEEMI